MWVKRKLPYCYISPPGAWWGQSLKAQTASNFPKGDTDRQHWCGLFSGGMYSVAGWRRSKDVAGISQLVECCLQTSRSFLLWFLDSNSAALSTLRFTLKKRNQSICLNFQGIKTAVYYVIDLSEMPIKMDLCFRSHVTLHPHSFFLLNVAPIPVGDQGPRSCVPSLSRPLGRINHSSAFKGRLCQGRPEGRGPSPRLLYLSPAHLQAGPIWASPRPRKNLSHGHFVSPQTPSYSVFLPLPLISWIPVRFYSYQVELRATCSPWGSCPTS